MRPVDVFAPWTMLLLAACSGETVARPPPPPVDWQAFVRSPPDAGSAAPTAKESARAEAYLTALGAAAFAPLGPLLDDDAHFSFPGRDDARERDGVVAAHKALFGAFDQRIFVASRIWCKADKQTAEWTMSGVQTGDWMGIVATKKPVSIRGVTLLWTRDDGKIVDAHIYFDVAAVKAELGAGPKELASLAGPPVAPAPPARQEAQVIDSKIDDTDGVPVVRAALDALENNVESAYLGQMADDVEVHTLEHAEPARGKEAARLYFKAMHNAIAQLDTTVQHGWSVASFAIVEYSIAGEQIGPIGWIPLQRDRVVNEHMVDIDEVRGGKIERIWRYDNPSELLTPGP